jgi:formylglycine-generating enzyme required for sulfatase activity
VEGFPAIGDDGHRDEAPAYVVHVHPFAIDARLVTVAAYRRCLQAGGCTWPVRGQGCHVEADAPIDCLNWFQADKFCKFAEKRLVTEVEWEYALKSAGREIEHDDVFAEWTSSDYCSYADSDCQARTKVTRGGAPAQGRLTARRSLEPGGWAANLGFRCAR